MSTIYYDSKPELNHMVMCAPLLCIHIQIDKVLANTYSSPLTLVPFTCDAAFRRVKWFISVGRVCVWFTGRVSTTDKNVIDHIRFEVVFIN